MSRPTASPPLAAATPAATAVDVPATTPGLEPGLPPRANATILQTILSPPVLGDELGWLGAYKVLRVVGRGGMGMVLEAEDSSLRRRVALKVMLPELAACATARDRFLREARAVAQLRNEHIVVIYQVGQERDVPFLAMELLEGQSLETRLQNGPPLAVPEIARLGRQIATGLCAAHRAGLIHRDIKPANIFLARASDGLSNADCPTVKLLDFGLARPTTDDARLTGSGQIVGTPYFMSPEQARGQGVDERSDLFSLGSVLYTMCAGRPPFAGDSVMAVLSALALDTPPSVREANPQVPVALAALIARLLEKDAARRPRSALEVVNALQTIEAQLAALQGTAIPQQTAANLSVPESPPRQAQSSDIGVRRARRPFAVVAVAAALLLFAATLFSLALFGGDQQPDQDADNSGSAAAADGSKNRLAPGPPLRIGILHSRSGTMSISERPVIDAMLLAVDEVNKQGGIFGRPIEPVIADGQSDAEVFGRQAEKLITEDRVSTLFGCWTSASRKAVNAVVERHNHLLLYPVSYEGMEQSPNIIYGGGVPNQYILPALKWFVGFQNRKRWFLVGSDYVFPRAAREVIGNLADTHGCQIVGEEFVLLGETDLTAVAKKIAAANPELIVNLLNGDSNIAFFRGLRRERILADKVPTISFSVSNEELSALPAGHIVGDYIASSYFQGSDSPPNRAFLSAFAARYGWERGISDPMQTAYYSVHLWADAVRAAGQAEPLAIRDALLGRRYDAPQGPVQIDAATHHTVQHARVLRFCLARDGTIQLKEEYLSPEPVPPEPFPTCRPPAAWHAFLRQLQRDWKGQWANPGP